MKAWIEEQIQDTYQSMIQALKNDQLELASHYERIINELKALL